MKKCKAITTKGVRCKMNVREDKEFCHFHRNNTQHFVAENQESFKKTPYKEKTRELPKMEEETSSESLSSKEVSSTEPSPQKKKIKEVSPLISKENKIEEDYLLVPTVLVTLVLAILAIMGWFFL